ncbi:hypothetical protein ACFLQ5_00290 [Bacteroidota bacterium]
MNQHIEAFFNTNIQATQNFINREVELINLHNFIEQTENNHLTILGISGIGKTYLASNFAMKLKKEKKLRVLWLNILKEPTYSCFIEILYKQLNNSSQKDTNENKFGKDIENIKILHHQYDILFIDNYNLIKDVNINNLMCVLNIKVVLISSCKLDLFSSEVIHLKPWEEHVTITLLKPLIWCGYIEGINGIKEIHSKSGGHPGIIDVFIKNLSNQSNEYPLYETLNAVLDDRFNALSEKDFEVLNFCLYLDQDKQYLLLKNNIEYENIIDKLLKYLLLERNVSGFYFMPYEPVFYGLIFEYFKNRYEKKSDYYEPSSFFEMVGNLYIATGNWKKAEAILLRYVEKSENTNDTRSLCIAYSQLAFVYQFKSDFTKEIEYCLKIIEYKNECEPEILIDTFILLGDNYRLRGEFASALERFSQAEDIFNLYPEERFLLQKARISLSKGFILIMKGDNIGADFLMRSLDLFRKINDIQGQGAVFVYQGIYELENNNLDSAERLLNEALNISHIGNNRMIEYFVQNLQSQLRFIQGKTEEAFSLCMKSITSKINLGTKHGIADSLMTFVPIFASLPDDFDKSQLMPILNNIRDYYSNFLTDRQKKLIQELKIIDNSIDLPILFSNCAIDMFKYLGSKYYLTKAKMEKAKIYISKREIESARKILSEIQDKYTKPYQYRKLELQIKTMLEEIS